MKRFISPLVFCGLLFVCSIVKTQSFDSLQNIRIVVTFTSAPSNYTVTKAPLRFNKLFAFSMEEDDGEKDIYTNAFPLLNGGTIIGVTYPGLKYTDGCGNDQKFKMSASIFSFASVGSDLVDVHDPASTYATINVTWPQMIEMYQQNWGIQNHGLTGGGGGTPGYEVARNGSYIKLKMLSATTGGPDEKIFVNPNGGDVYSPFAWAQGYTVCYREGYSFGDPSFNVSGSFPHQNIGMHRTNTYEAVNLATLVNGIASASTGGAHNWGVAFTHSVTSSNYGYSFTTFQNYMNYIANTYGKNGLDNIYMTTEEEVIDYLMVRDSIQLNTQLVGNVLTISFTGHLNNTYRYYNSTLLISANQNIASISTQGVQSSSSKGVGLSSGMVNFSWNGHYIVPAEVTAETWVSKTEASHSQEDANVAMDYILMVTPGPVQKAFRLRLCQVTGITMPSDFCTYRNAPVSRLPVTGGCPSHSLVIPVVVDSFLTIKACYQRIEYDPAVMTFVSGAASKPSVLSGMQITNSAVGGSSTLYKIIISWSGTIAKSLSVHDTLALLTFNYISGNTGLTFNTTSNNGSDCRYVDDGGHAMYQYPSGTYFVNGQVANARLPAPAAVTGPASLCQGTSGNTYIVSPVAGAITYSWTFPTGFIITQGAGNDTVVVTAGPNAVSGNILVRAVNLCTDNPQSPPFAVSLKPRPSPVISGPGSCCAMTSGLSYLTDAGMTDYSWSVSSGGAITSGQGTNAVTVNWTLPGSQTLSVVYRGSNGCLASVPTVKNVTVNPLPVPLITGSDTVCRTALATFVTSGGMQSYQWQVSPSGTIVSGASSSAVNVKWDNTGPQWISLNCVNTYGCQALSPVVKNIFVRPIAQPVITGRDSLCDGATGIGYSTQPGMSGYTWNIVSGGTITSGAGTFSVTAQWTSPGIHQIQVNYTVPGGCPATTPYILPVNVHARPQPNIYGPSELCKGSSGALFYTDMWMSNYQWAISSGGVISSGSNTDSITTSWIASGSNHVSVTYTNSFGCTPSTPAIYPVTVDPLPVPAIIGPASICNTSIGIIYSTQPGNTNYSWTITPGGTITSAQGNDTIHVNWNSTGLQQITVNFTDSNFCTSPAPTSYPVLVFARPTPSITGPATVCSGTTVTYSTQISMSGYVWTISAGGTIVSGQGTQMIQVVWNQSGTGTVSVNYANSSGCFAVNPFPYNVTIHPSPLPTITGPDSLCMNETGIYTTESGMSGYQWVISPGGSVVTGLGTNSVHITWTTAGPRTVSVNYLNTYSCSALIPSVMPVVIFPLPLPSISGSGSVCANSSEVYITQSGMNNYVWTVSSGGVISAGQGTFSVTVSWGNQGSSSVSVTYTSPLGCDPAAPAVKAVTINPRPVPVISGSSTVCLNGGPKTYSTQSGQLNYIWNIPAGDTILNGQSTPSVTVQWNSLGNHGMSVTFSSQAGCQAAAPGTLTVTVNASPSAASAITGPTVVCVPASWQEYSIAPVTYASGYFWSLPSGSVFQGSSNTNVIHVTYLPTAQSGNISVYGTNACGNGTASSLFVKANPTPPKPVISLGTGNILLSSSLHGNQWYLNYQPMAGDTLNHLHVLVTGEYYTIVTLVNCKSDTSNIEYVTAVGIIENAGFSIDVHPNPVKGSLTIGFVSPSEQNYKATIFNELGSPLYQSEKLIPKGESSWVIDIGNISPGPVLLLIQSPEGSIRKKIIKQ